MKGNGRLTKKKQVFKSFVDIFNDEKARKKLPVFLVATTFLELLGFFIWVQWMGNANFLDSEKIEFRIVNIIEKIIIWGLPFIISLIGVIFIRHKFTGTLGILTSFPFVLVYSIIVNKSVVQAGSSRYWFFVPAVFWFLLLQTAISVIIGLIFVIIMDILTIYKAYRKKKHFT